MSRPFVTQHWREIVTEAAGTAAGAALPALPPCLVGAPPDAAARLAALDLLVVGVGAVGAPIVDGLAALRPRRVRIVDPQAYEPGNLTSQPIGPEALGQSKAEVVGRRLKGRSPRTQVLVAPCRFEELGIGELHSAQAVLLAGDSLALTEAVAERACALGQVLIQASVHGPTGIAQVRRTLPRPAGPRACVCCGWDAGERRALERETRFTCDGTGAPLPRAGAPTGALSALSSLAASFAVFEVVRWALALDQGRDEIVEYSALTRSAVVSPLPSNPRCPVAHAPWRRVQAPRPLTDLSPGEIFALAFPQTAARIQRRELELEGWAFSSVGQCGCKRHPPTRRFVPPDSGGLLLGTCESCGGDLRVHAFHEHDRVPGPLLTGVLRRKLRDLGVDRADAAMVRGHADCAMVLGPGDEDAR